jgi:hypothetical protein
VFILKAELALSQNRDMLAYGNVRRKMLGKSVHWVIRKFGQPDSLANDPNGAFIYLYETKEFRNEHDLKHANYSRPSTWYVYWVIYISKNAHIYRVEGIVTADKVNLGKLDYTQLTSNIEDF